MKHKNENKKEWFLYLMVGGLLLTVSILHYLTPYDKPLFHALYRLLYYVPIILAAFLWGKRGGVILSLAINIAYLPHIIVAWNQIEMHSIIAIMEILLYYIVGIITGHLIDRARGEARKREELLDRFRLTEMNTALGQISYIITHELKTPLASISGAVDILCEDIEITPDKKRFVTILQSEIERIHNLLNKTLSSFSTGSLHLQKLDLIEYLTEIKDLLSVIKERQKVEFTISIETDIKTITIDKDLFKEALINLINNAMEAVHQQGKVGLTVTSDDKNLTLTITDNGPGIPEDEQSLVFKAFYSNKKGGKGLGLSIVKRIVQLHKGSIKLNKDYKKGAQFVIRLGLKDIIHD